MNDQVIAQRSLTEAAPDFWPWPERPELVALVLDGDPLSNSPRPKAKGKNSGKIATKDALLCRSVCIDLLTGGISEREIAARHRIGRHTLHAIRDVMRERGEMAPLEQTIRTGLSNCIVLMLLRLREALIAGEYSAAQIPIALCALIDKKGQLDAGIVPGTERTEAEAWESQVDVAWRALQRARSVSPLAGPGSGPSECASGDQAGQVVDVQASVVPPSPPATAPATGSAAAGASVQTSGPAAGPGALEARPDQAAELEAGEEGGRGVSAAGGPPHPGRVTPQNFGPKEPL